MLARRAGFVLIKHFLGDLQGVFNVLPVDILVGDKAHQLRSAVADPPGGKASKYTRSRLPVKLVYYQAYDTKSAAVKREAQIKRMTRKGKLELIYGG
ncbi:MAG: hypothetical protein RDV00_02550 [Clostridia bacterium]|jgi:putative endonuclease|nr:hypothetical protein [Clostridia bacterium]MDQ7790988.1 hypothetical protein [Clostridia bacterium]